MEKFIFEGLVFKMSSVASPEQWDIYRNGSEIGYVHLRNGILTCRLYENEYPLYIKNFADINKNSFEDDSETSRYLIKVANAIEID